MPGRPSRVRFVRVWSLLVALALAAACSRSAPRDVRATATSTTGNVATSAAPHLTSAPTSPSTAAAALPRGGTRAPRATTTSTAAAPAADRVKATPVVVLDHPIGMTFRPGEPESIFIAEKRGTLRRVPTHPSSASPDAATVLDISSRVSKGPEQGLLGVVFSADGATIYADYTDVDGNIRVVAYPYANGVADATAERLIIAIPHPDKPSHNGGQVAFGRDGHLYISVGDGGGANPGDPNGNAQNLNVLLGKILRIAPNPSGSGYTIPADNPFVGQSGRRGEIWHFGLRNPWRFSFDRANGDQWISDVGQADYEEVNHVGLGVKGANFGWNKREGKHPYKGGKRPAGAVDPEFEITHADGNCSIVGGYVYRGAAARRLVGAYIFTDFCRGELVAYRGGAESDLGVKVEQPTSLGEDARGELWVLSYPGPVYRLDPLVA